MIYTRPFTAAHARQLAPKIGEVDLKEIRLAGYPDAESALLSGLKVGPCWGVLDEGEVLGVFGYSAQGIIWSFWSTLTKRQALTVLRHTRDYVSRMVKRSGKPILVNAVLRENTPVLRWLEASKCFDLWNDPSSPLIYFHTKPELSASCVIQQAAS